MTKNKKALYLILFLIVALTAFIWYNSTVNKSDSGELSQSIAAKALGIFNIEDQKIIEQANHIIRKIAHFTEFFVLGLFYCLVCVFQKSKATSTIFFPMFCTMSTAVIDEFIQSFSDRGPALSDVLLDFSGALSGILAVIFIRRMMKRRTFE